MITGVERACQGIKDELAVQAQAADHDAERLLRVFETIKSEDRRPDTMKVAPAQRHYQPEPAGR